MSQYHIYQTDAEYSFLSWNLAKRYFNFNDYRKVYSGELLDTITYGNSTITCNTEDVQVLEEIFERFNINHPEDYKARSLSTSDIVEIVRKDGSEFYYCDSIGWRWLDIGLIEPSNELKR